MRNAQVARENPFRYGEIATGTYFTNRAAELDELGSDIRSGQNVVIISPRRYGKTSLVFEAIERAKRDGTLVAYLDLFRTPTPDLLADHLASAIYDGLVAPFERVWQRTVDFFQRLPLRPKITLNQDGTPSFEFTAGAQERDLQRTIEGLLALPGQIASERRRRVALVLDEFQEVLTIDPHLPAVMRSIFQTQGEVAHIFLGSRRHLMEHVFTDQHEPLYKLAKPLPLHPISRPDFASFIRERFAATGMTIADDGVEEILAVTEGHPHDTQELCYFTWYLAHVEGVVADRWLVDRALDRVLDAEDARYSTVWESLTPHQRLVLSAVAADPGAVFSEHYRRRHRLGPPSSVSRSLQRLVERELAETTPSGGYRIPDAFLRAWLERMSAPTSL